MTRMFILILGRKGWADYMLHGQSLFYCSLFDYWSVFSLSICLLYVIVNREVGLRSSIGLKTLVDRQKESILPVLCVVRFKLTGYGLSIDRVVTDDFLLVGVVLRFG